MPASASLLCLEANDFVLRRAAARFAGGAVRVTGLEEVFLAPGVEGALPQPGWAGAHDWCGALLRPALRGVATAEGIRDPEWLEDADPRLRASIDGGIFSGAGAHLVLGCAPGVFHASSEALRMLQLESTVSSSGMLSLVRGLVRSGACRDGLVLWDAGESHSVLFHLDANGVQSVEKIPFGLDCIFERLRAELSLKLRGAAARVFFSDSFDLSDLGPRIAQGVSEDLIPFVRAFGDSPRSLMIEGLPASHHWFQTALAECLGLESLQLNLPEAAESLGLQLDLESEVSGPAVRWLGLLSFLDSAGRPGSNQAAAWCLPKVVKPATPPIVTIPAERLASPGPLTEGATWSMPKADADPVRAETSSFAARVGALLAGQAGLRDADAFGQPIQDTAAGHPRVPVPELLRPKREMPPSMPAVPNDSGTTGKTWAAIAALNAAHKATAPAIPAPLAVGMGPPGASVRPSRRGRGWLVAGVCVLAAAGLSAWLSWRPSGPSKEAGSALGTEVSTPALAFSDQGGRVLFHTKPRLVQVNLGAHSVTYTPGRPLDLPSGNQVIRLSHPGFMSREVPVEVRPGELETLGLIELRRATGALQIVSNLEGVRAHLIPVQAEAGVLDVPEIEGILPILLDRAVVARYRAVFSRDGWPLQRSEIEVVAGGEVKESVAFPAARVDLLSDPAGAEVWVNDVRQGVTPLLDWPLSPGSLRIRYLLRGYRPYEELMVLRDGSTNRLSARLVAEGRIFSSDELDVQPIPVVLSGPAVAGMEGRPMGRVRVSLIVDSVGRAREARVIESSDPDWAQRVLDASANWRFRPGEISGRPVDAQIEVPLIVGR